MNIKFEKIHIENFLSFENETINLADDGFTIVEGINANDGDNSTSNGSGKSSIFEALVWALTGSTMRGCKEVKNQNTTDGVFVELCFYVDGTPYRIVRTKDHPKFKTNLKIFVDGEDKSGKGIRDTSEILAQYLPDLTNEILASVIVLGQGMPSKFTNNSPSGRKEILEKLSKSDFMIEDLKRRVSQRKAILNQKAQELTTQKAVLEHTVIDSNTRISALEAKIEELKSVSIDGTEIDNFQTCALSLKTEKFNATKKQIDLLQDIEHLKDLRKEEQDKLEESIKQNKEKYSQTIEQYKDSIYPIDVEISTILQQIKQIENMTDICPTCHQKLNVQIPDATPLKNQLAEKEEARNKIQQALKEIIDESVNQEQEIYNTFNPIIKSQEDLIVATERELLNTNIEISDIEERLNETNAKIQDLSNKIACRDVQLTTYIDEKAETEHTRATAIEKQAELEVKSSENIKHLEVINKFETLLKRDFRGYLLGNIIEFIDNKVKEYAIKVFGHSNISFTLDGNNISIKYWNKEYENLSGGEKQKIDIIVQFALRSMLCTYMSFNSSLLVLDEIFDSLDREGCQKIIDLIYDELGEVSSIYMISHHIDELNIPFDHKITVIKGIDNISRIK